MYFHAPGIDVIDGMLFLVDVHVDSMTGINALVSYDVAVIQILDARHSYYCFLYF